MAKELLKELSLCDNLAGFQILSVALNMKDVQAGDICLKHVSCHYIVKFCLSKVAFFSLADFEVDG